MFGTGGGITWDSRADDEYAEALAKTACLAPTPTFDLVETMHLEGGTYARLDGHLVRLHRSSAYFDRPFDAATTLDALESHACQVSRGPHRVRVRLDANGTPHITSEPFSSSPEATRPIVLASTPVSRTDRWLYHKTTHRTMYERHRAEHPEAFDVLLWNDDGELTEFTIGNLVVELDGQRCSRPSPAACCPASSGRRCSPMAPSTNAS